jgi:hypothetical protein
MNFIQAITGYTWENSRLAATCLIEVFGLDLMKVSGHVVQSMLTSHSLIIVLGYSRVYRSI